MNIRKYKKGMDNRTGFGLKEALKHDSVLSQVQTRMTVGTVHLIDTENIRYTPWRAAVRSVCSRLVTCYCSQFDWSMRSIHKKELSDHCSHFAKSSPFSTLYHISSHAEKH